MNRPKKLHIGDRIGLIAPARKVSPHEMKAFIDETSSWGLIPVEGPNLYKQNHQFSGTDKERAADFQMMLDDPDIKAIFCARGGYGSIRLLADLDFENFIKNPKWLIGFSDITVFHSYLQRQLSVCSIHGLMPFQFGKLVDYPEAFTSLKNVLFGKYQDIVFKKEEMNTTREMEGTLIGGNLSIVYSLRGTAMDIDPEGKILFLEDLDEHLYHIDRMMRNLEAGGILKKVRGVLLGYMSDMNDNDIPFGQSAIEIVSDACKRNETPLIAGFPAGHLHPNYPLLMGAKVKVFENGDKMILSYV